MGLLTLGRATRRPAARLTAAPLLAIVILGASGPAPALAQTETTTTLAALPGVASLGSAGEVHGDGEG